MAGAWQGAGSGINPRHGMCQLSQDTLVDLYTGLTGVWCSQVLSFIYPGKMMRFPIYFHPEYRTKEGTS